MASRPPAPRISRSNNGPLGGFEVMAVALVLLILLARLLA